MIIIQILERNGEDPAGGSIIVFTDGEENEAPSVISVTKDVLSKVSALCYN